jgi:hypothetical protein
MDPRIAHRGISAADPRNAGPIEYFRPKKVTRASVRARLAPYYARRGEVELAAKVDAVIERIARGPTRPDPPMSQPLDAVADPWMGLGTHPDIIEEMWRLDDALPVRCRWVFWGGPALVHPVSGIVFAVGFGTVGFVVRLPQPLRAGAEPDCAAAVLKGNPGQTFDISAAGPEWRFLRAKAPRMEWMRAAYDFAGEAF